jgi:RNA polymerase sigma-70 factor (ECF subfamily)
VATSDSDLLNAARKHVPEAWDTLLKRHQLPLYTYAAELLRDDDAALDVVQETFATAVRHIASLRADHKFSSWLFGIAHQKCVQHWRNVRRDGKVFATTEADTQLVDVADADGADPRALLLQREQADELLALVGRLAAPHRSVLLLYVLENFSIEEIAAITSAPVGTIKSRLHYAKRALRQLLERTRCVT